MRGLRGPLMRGMLMRACLLARGCRLPLVRRLHMRGRRMLRRLVLRGRTRGPLRLMWLMLLMLLMGSRPKMRMLAGCSWLVLLSLFHDDRLSMEPCV